MGEGVARVRFHHSLGDMPTREPQAEQRLGTQNYPDLLVLAFLGKKARNPCKKQRYSFLSADPLKILGKERDNAQKSKENRKTKKQGNGEKQGLEGKGTTYKKLF